MLDKSGLPNAYKPFGFGTGEVLSLEFEPELPFIMKFVEVSARNDGLSFRLGSMSNVFFVIGMFIENIKFYPENRVLKIALNEVKTIIEG